MVFYRKYRPQTLDELIGQDQVKKTLLQAYNSNKLSHAYLFVGPRGSGKTSTARILAKMVNCEAAVSGSKDQIPCNKCSTCLTITDGSNLDLIEIDAASNRGIDDIRELRDKIKLSPSSSPKKVYIIDEVHMLTTEAFNALLKTLEEPPAHVLFVLATTEAHKIPQTILSRVQRLDFELASSENLILALKNVSEKEGIKVSAEALKLLSKKGEGSFRDSLKLLDQLASSGEEITLELVETRLNQGSFSDLSNIVEIISKKEAQAGLEFIQNLNQKGVSIKEFTVSLMETFRLMMLIKNGVLLEAKDEFGSEKYELVLGLTKKFEMPDLIRILKLLSESLEKLKYSLLPLLPLEIALIEACASQIPIEISREAKTQIPVERVQSFNKTQENRVPEETKQIPQVQMAQTPVSLADNVSSADMLVLTDKWGYILETIKPYNYSLEALLKQAKLVGCEDGQVTLEVPYSFHQRILDAPKSRSLLESVMADVLSKPVRVVTVLGNRPVRVEELANVELAQDDEIIQIASEIFNS